MTTRNRNPTTTFEYVRTQTMTGEAYDTAFADAGVQTTTDFLELTIRDFEMMAGLTLVQRKRAGLVQKWYRSHENVDLNLWWTLTTVLFEEHKELLRRLASPWHQVHLG